MASVTDKNAIRITKIICDPLPAIELGGGKAAAGKPLRWGLVLMWFMRVVALLWVFHSLLNWGSLLGVEVLARNDVSKLGIRPFTAAVAFAGIDPIAAVGLWLATPWGGVVWLLAVATQIAAVFALPHQFTNGLLLVSTDIGLVICYFILTFAAEREAD